MSHEIQSWNMYYQNLSKWHTAHADVYVYKKQFRWGARDQKLPIVVTFLSFGDFEPLWDK